MKILTDQNSVRSRIFDILPIIICFIFLSILNQINFLEILKFIVLWIILISLGSTFNFYSKKKDVDIDESAVTGFIFLGIFQFIFVISGIERDSSKIFFYILFSFSLFVLIKKIYKRKIEFKKNYSSKILFLILIPVGILIYANSIKYELFSNLGQIDDMHSDFLNFYRIGQIVSEDGLKALFPVNDPDSVRYHWFVYFMATETGKFFYIDLKDIYLIFIPFFATLHFLRISESIFIKLMGNKRKIYLVTFSLLFMSIPIVGRSGFINYDSPSQTIGMLFFSLVFLKMIDNTLTKSGMLFMSAIMPVTKASMFAGIISIFPLIYRKNEAKSQLQAIALLIVPTLLSYFFFIYGNTSSSLNLEVGFRNKTFILEIFKYVTEIPMALLILLILITTLGYMCLLKSSFKFSKQYKYYVAYFIMLIFFISICLDSSFTNIMWFIIPSAYPLTILFIIKLSYLQTSKYFSLTLEFCFISILILNKYHFLFI